MQQIIFTIILLTVAVSSVFSQNKISKEEYEVYAYKVNQIILNETSVYDLENDIRMLEKLFTKQISGLLDDFIEKNRQHHRLDKKIATKFRYRLISQMEKEKAFNMEDDPNDLDKGWRNFYKTFPNSGGYRSFSRVGLSKDKKYALLYVDTSCGSLCGSGVYYLFSKINGKWKEQKSLRVSIS